MTVPRVVATARVAEAPCWALLQRRLLAAIDASVAPFMAKYVDERGWLIWHDVLPVPTRDGADDFYEPFYNWPLAYMMGAGDHLLELSHRQHRAITEQCEALGYVAHEFEIGYDAFHTGESLLFFYFLCLADPGDGRLRRLARQFADLYADPASPAGNYDAERRIVRAPHNGSEGPRWGYLGGDAIYGWRERMRPHGLPYADIEGIGHYDDLRDPAKARAMGAAMEWRMGRGDTVANLCLTSLATNAFALTGDERYRRWVLDYVGGWEERAAANDGIVPDNVGLSGEVGEYVGGRWHGGAYGWEWPHGYYSVGMAALVAASNAFLLTRDPHHFDLYRAIIDRLRALGGRRAVENEEMSMRHHWIGLMPEQGEAFLVPYRIGPDGWFDYQPPSPIYPVALALLSNAAEDRARLDWHREVAGFDWTAVDRLRNKEDAGHETPWLSWLDGALPGYPEMILNVALEQVARRLAQIHDDRTDPLGNHIHHWQQLNPVTTEALLQLVMGAPSPLYNGGLLNARLAWFDVERRRPGLPPGVAALVEGMSAERAVVRIVNLDMNGSRTLLLQAGAYREHRFERVSYDVATRAAPDTVGDYAGPAWHRETREETVDGDLIEVVLPPYSEIRLDLAMRCNVADPATGSPWAAL